MSDYYKIQDKTTANSNEFLVGENTPQRFPIDGFYIGDLRSNGMKIPALVDFKEIKGLCFLYNSIDTRITVNRCLERLLWRIAVSIPSKLCDFIIYNGGNPGENFNSASLINDKLFQKEKVYFSGIVDKFAKRIDELISEIPSRMSEICLSGCTNLVELNEKKGEEATFQYKFVVLSDFPHNLTPETMNKLSQLVRSGNQAGIFTIMTWNSTAQIDTDKYASQIFNPAELIKNLMLVYPGSDRFFFRNSGHDDALNRFSLTLDDDSIHIKDAQSWATYIDKQVEIAYAAKKRDAISQNFGMLASAPYTDTVSEICVTIGRDLDNEQPVTVRFNSKDYIHAFILGQSGSGKSVLLNNIITSAILKYSPEDLVLYLMDFKGVEFNKYKGLKHTKAVLVDNSDPQMTLEVLRELKEENKYRTTLWRQAGVSNIDGYNIRNPQNKMPQILFVADECQVMFKTPSGNSMLMQVQREISEILNIIATQGRSQGIHMLLATQQLDETDISGQILKNLTECFLLMSAPSDSDRLVPESSEMTAKQQTGIACYYHKKELQNQVQTFYAPDEELQEAIQMAQEKAKSHKSNGAAYFSGSSIFQLGDTDIAEVEDATSNTPISFVGRNIGIHGGATSITLYDDFSENILFFGANKEEQTTGVLMNAFISLMYSYKKLSRSCDFLVIDCYTNENSKYKDVLTHLEEQGLCHLIERKNSGRTLSAIAGDIKNGCARPVVLAIIGSERYIEMKRNLPLQEQLAEQAADDFSSDMIVPLSFDLQLDDLSDTSSPATNPTNMTFQQALTYILEEGPNQGVHILLQVDKPANILFNGDYDVNATDKFRHKIMLRSENKYLFPMRFSQEIDVEMLSDEEEHLRAYYYPEDGDPILFTPYIMPDAEKIK